MNITPEENDLLLEIAREFDYPEYDPKRHLLIKQMADHWEITLNGAANRLNKLVKRGKLEVEKIRMDTGKICNGYFKPESP